MKLLRNYEPALRYGAKILPSEISGGVGLSGNVYYVVPSTESFYDQFIADNQYSYPDGSQAVYTTLELAYAACVSNRGDMIILAGDVIHTVSAGFEWSKGRITVVGMGTSRFVQQGARVQNVVGDTAAYVLKVTGNRNSFINVKFIQISTNAAALSVVTDGAEGTHYENCSFVFGVINNLGGTTAHEFVAGTDSGTFINCTFGADTLLTSGARSVFHIKTITALQEFKSNILQNCNFIISSSSGTATFVRLDAITDILFTNIFKDCTFVASVDTAGGAAIAEASQTGTGTTKGVLCYVRPAAFNVTDFATATNGRNTATQVVAAVSVAAAVEGIKPTA